jgi:endonuclease G
LALGNPSSATTSTANPNNYLMIKPQYALAYNNARRIPRWVSWALNSSWIGSASRQDDFRPDTTLPSNWYRVGGSDYSGSGFDRGHMAPSADRTSSTADNSATFLMTNMIPQAPDNNQGPWAELENYTRSLVTSSNEIYIITGEYGDCGTGSNGRRCELVTSSGNRIAVPARTWKVIVIVNSRGAGAGGVNTNTRVIAVDMPNEQGIRSVPWRNYRVTVRDIESRTGLNLLSNVPASIQEVIETRRDTL